MDEDTAAAADSILASVRKLRGTCSTAAMPERQSCSRFVSSIQLRVTTKGGNMVDAEDLEFLSRVSVIIL